MDNRPIGVLKIEGDDFENGIIETGADLICEYEIDDSGTIRLEVSVPSVSGVFSAGHNFYSRQESAINYSDAAELVVNDADSTLERVKRISDVVIDPELDRLTRRLTRVRSLNPDKAQTEDTQEAMETVLESRRKLASIRKAHLKEIRQAELDDEVREFNDFARADANPTEIQSFEYQQQAAQRIIDRNEPGFEGCLRRIRSNTFRIRWRDPKYVVSYFRYYTDNPHWYRDKARFQELLKRGCGSIANRNYDELREIVYELNSIVFRDGSDDADLASDANILRG